MEKFFTVMVVAFILLIIIMAVKVFKGETIFDKLNALFSISTMVIVIMALVGYTDGREDMYIDIAISYAVLSFITSIILAKFIGGSHGDH